MRDVQPGVAGGGEADEARHFEAFQDVPRAREGVAGGVANASASNAILVDGSLNCLPILFVLKKSTRSP